MDLLETLPKRLYKEYLLTLVLVAIGGYLFIRISSLASVRAVLLRTDFFMYVLAVGAYYVSIPIRTYRWQSLLKEVDVTISSVPGNVFVMLSLYFNTLLPAKIGDLYKCQLVGRQYDASRATVLGTVGVERVVDILLLLSGVLLSIVFLVSHFTRSVYHVIVLVFASTVLVLMVIALLAVVPAVFLPSRIRYMITELRTGLASIASRSMLFRITVISILIWLVNILRIGLIVHALSVQISVPGIVFFALLISFLTGLPYTPAGIGVVELVGAVALVALGIPSAVSVSIIILDRLITVGSVLVTGTLLYLHLRTSCSKLLTGDPLI